MSKPESWKSWEGRLVNGRFLLGRWLGGSDHSAVFQTELRGSSPQSAAIKLSPAESSAAADIQLLHLRAAIKLSHPNLIRILEADRCEINGESMVYAVMECAEEDLSQVLPQRALEPAEVQNLLPPLLQVLSYLHDQGLVHGRIKPSNVLAVGDQLKLSADQVRSAAEQNAQHRRRDDYDAPESAAGIISPAGDVWSLGVMIIAVFTQKTSLAEKEAGGDPKLPRSIPERYRVIARECLHLDPKQRCSLKEIQRRLQAPTPSNYSAIATSEPVPAGSAFKRPPYAITIAMAIVLGIVFVIFYLRGKPPVQNSTSDQPSAESARPVPPPVSAAPASTPQSHAPGGEVAHQVLPEIPQSARNTISGTIRVVVRVQVDSSGKVTSAKLKTPGSSHYFADLALKAARNWEFSAPLTDGQPAASTWLVQFRFKRSSTQASAQRTKD